MDGEDRVALDARECLIERRPVDSQLARAFHEHERGVALVQVPRAWLDSQSSQGANATDAEDHLLVQPHLAAADVEDVGDRPVRLVVVGNIRVEQQQRHAADLSSPHGAVDGPAGHLDADAQRAAIFVRHAEQRQALRVVVGVGVLLVTVGVDVLAKVAVAIEEAYPDERDGHVRRCLEVVAGKHAEAA